MNKEVFIKTMAALAPPEKEFSSMGVSPSFIKSTIDRYHAEHRAKTKPHVEYSDEIIQMLQLYDCSKLRIGLLTFLKDPLEFQDFVQVGKVDIDVLTINKITHEIEVRDHDAPDYVIWPCAMNSSCFLDALIVCAEYLRQLLTNNSLSENRRLLLGVVETCSEESGGERFIDFYKMLLGYW